MFGRGSRFISFFKRNKNSFEGTLYAVVQGSSAKVLYQNCQLRLESPEDELDPTSPYHITIERSAEEYVDEEDEMTNSIRFAVVPAVVPSTYEARDVIGVAFSVNNRRFVFGMEEGDEDEYNRLKQLIAGAVVSVRDGIPNADVSLAEADRILAPLISSGHEPTRFTLPMPWGPVPTLDPTEVLFSCSADLMGAKDEHGRSWELLTANTRVTVAELEDRSGYEAWECYLVIKTGDMGQTLLPINDAMYPKFESKTQRFMFLVNLNKVPTGADDPYLVVALDIKNLGDYEALRDLVTRRLVIKTREAAGYKAADNKKQAEIDYLARAMEDVDIDMDTEYGSDFHDSDLEYDSAFDDEKEVVYSPSPGDKRDAITGVMASKSSGVAFVTRGSTFERIKTNADSFFAAPDDEDNEISWNVADRQGRMITPKQMMLRQQDAKMIVLGDDKRSAYVMDVERGQIVEEYKANKDGVDFNIDNIFAHTKDDERSQEQLFGGLNKTSFFLMDPRLAGDNKMVAAQSYQYRSNQQLSCSAVTAEGNLVIGTAKGEVKLFNAYDKRAKTNYPGTGDAIIGVDVTKDGKWVLATTKRYVMLLSTSIQGSTQTGFQKSVPVDQKRPYRLSLSPADVAAMGGHLQINFTPARFNTGRGMERFIVAGVNSKVVIWSLSKVLKGDKCYDIVEKAKEDHVVGTDLNYDSMDVVVAFDDSVRVEARRKRGQ
ncbi:Vacuolar import/degradation, Vid27-related [Carpediemonas membranifera]|uniref:Vacuolar import/degradation, Vid27-related n=1 Tax=Carpediemonas membranifera TaxID=201153 RepID=A0A8J6DZU9_9EUKA|nr:Vacuolar import/degradation, Vid27-related [Carpediemonas membranifera]|eukprot:KAG9394149.1 Vacuolar import/degradation, Vid27-related [Carpediemonas membranifera]